MSILFMVFNVLKPIYPTAINMFTGVLGLYISPDGAGNRYLLG